MHAKTVHRLAGGHEMSQSAAAVRMGRQSYLLGLGTVESAYYCTRAGPWNARRGAECVLLGAVRARRGHQLSFAFTAKDPQLTRQVGIAQTGRHDENAAG